MTIALNSSKDPYSRITLAQQIDTLAKDISRVQLMSGDRSSFYTAYIPMPVTKYKFTRANWYSANLPWQQGAEVLAWCTEQFGQRPAVRDAWTRWYHSMSILYFRDRDDYMLFVLTWGK